MAAGIGREATNAHLAQRMFNSGAGRPVGVQARARLILAVLLAVCLPIAFFGPGPAHAEAPVCQVPDLQLYMIGQGATMHFVGSFILRNLGAQPCILLPPTRVEMLDSGGTAIPQAHVYNGFVPAKSVLLPPGQQVSIRFDWYPDKESCVSRSFRASPALRLTTLAADSEDILQFDWNGALYVCDTPDEYMRLVIGPFGDISSPRPDRALLQLPLTGIGGSGERSALQVGVLIALGGMLAVGGFVLALRVRELDAVSG